MTNTTAAALTTADLDTMTRDDRWEGFGYLGERHRAPADVAARFAAADALILGAADAHGWTYDDLFTWANSKNGRWFGDEVRGTNRELTTDLLARYL